MAVHTWSLPQSLLRVQCPTVQLDRVAIQSAMVATLRAVRMAEWYTNGRSGLGGGLHLQINSNPSIELQQSRAVWQVLSRDKGRHTDARYQSQCV